MMKLGNGGYKGIFYCPNEFQTPEKKVHNRGSNSKFCIFHSCKIHRKYINLIVDFR